MTDKIVRLVPKTGFPKDEDETLGAWLRGLADQADRGELGNLDGAAIVFAVSEGDGFRMKMRRHKLSYLETLGAFDLMAHDMRHS